MSIARKFLGILIVGYIAYGWLGSFLDSNNGQKRLVELSKLTIGDIYSIEAISDDYESIQTKTLNLPESKSMLLRAIGNANGASVFVRAPKHKKLFLKINTSKGIFGLDVFVPLKKSDAVQFFLVNRRYSGQGFTQDTFGLWQSKELWEFLVSANLVTKSQ